MLRPYGHLLIASQQSPRQEARSIVQRSENPIEWWKWVGIFDRHLVELPVIHINSKSAIIFMDDNSPRGKGSFSLVRNGKDAQTLESSELSLSLPKNATHVGYGSSLVPAR